MWVEKAEMEETQHEETKEDQFDFFKRLVHSKLMRFSNSQS